MNPGPIWGATVDHRYEDASSRVAFEDLFQAEYRVLFRALYLITGNTEEAEELMQDAFLKVLERWDRVSRMENPAGYLTGSPSTWRATGSGD